MQIKHDFSGFEVGGGHILISYKLGYIFVSNLHWNITKQPYIEKMTITEMKIYTWVRSRRNSVSPIVPKRPQSVPQRPHRDLAAKVESEKFLFEWQLYQNMAGSKFRFRCQDHA